MGPILHPAQFLSTPTHVSLLVCTRRKADFPLQQTRATTLERRVGEKQRRLPAQMIHGALAAVAQVVERVGW